VASGDDEERLAPLVERFNHLRAGRADPARVRPLLAPVEAFYRPLIEGAWVLLWRCWARERVDPEARSVERRWRADRLAYTTHIDWLTRNGLRRTRQTARQAAQTLHRLERAGVLLEAEQACDDPLRMAPAVLTHQAVCGQVVHVDREHQERAAVRRVSRPLVTLRSHRPCHMVPGKRLWWADEPGGREYLVRAVAPWLDGGAEVTLALQTSSPTRLPEVGTQACFSVYTTGRSFFTLLPPETPWTHSPSVSLPAPGAIEE
jgi:hypothetical protein